MEQIFCDHNYLQLTLKNQAQIKFSSISLMSIIEFARLKAIFKKELKYDDSFS